MARNANLSEGMRDFAEQSAEQARKMADFGAFGMRDFAEQSGPSGDNPPARIGVGIEQTVHGKTGWRNFGDGVSAPIEQIPELLRGIRAAGQTTAETDHCNGFRLFPLFRAQPKAHFLDSGNRPLQELFAVSLHRVRSPEKDQAEPVRRRVGSQAQFR